MARFHIIAWGSHDHPDLDYESDIRPTDLSWKYPFVTVVALTPVSIADVRDDLLNKAASPSA